ncbi:amidohydrolase [Sedimentibacter sp. zth1]|uniref:amidohydrolase n=1 Tax=Sedimentibacter sp. zth1 TaxID=2816908 RepID=UPI001A91F298|nr:amidohydrolase [Sedimentibacter sp. zth1]QSX04831.1 amidohydrolase [Sedimentibacter sp. zth1]
MPQKCYFNGDIITLENEMYADYLLIENDKIVCVGAKKEIEKYIYNDAEMIDLQKKTLMPAFIDTHSLFFEYVFSLLYANLSDAESFDDIKKLLISYKEDNHIKDGEWIIGSNYDDDFLKEKKPPTAKILDSILPNNPVVLQHQSGYSGVLNSKALEILKIDKINDGFLKEEQFTANLQKIPIPSINDFKNAILKVQEKYASFGITTMQEGTLVDSMDKILTLIIQAKLLKLDLVGYIDIKNGNKILEKFDESIKKYNNRFKIGGYKIFLDGSPHNKTAWMLEQYKDTENHNGKPYYKDFSLTIDFKKAISDNMQVLAHCNGDAAAKQYIECYKKAFNSSKRKHNIRPVIIHAQLLTEEQLIEAKKLDIIPSFLVANIFYSGDILIKNFGLERASQINITGSAVRNNVLFTFHQNPPTIEINMLETICYAVNRITKEGRILGVNQRITPLDALKAVTINAAYQYFEENIKGSLKHGKLADLVILDSNPLKVEYNKIKNIKVLETIKEGKTVFKL